MFSNIFHTKGIATSNPKGGFSAELPSVSKFSTPTSNFNNENMSDSFMVRPTTAFMKVFDKFSAISGFGNTSGNNVDNINSFTSGANKDKKQNNILAAQLQSKIGKISRLENRLMSLQDSLTNDLIDWGSGIPNPDSERMVKNFSMLLAAQKDSSVLIIEKLDKLKLNLAFVNEREKKQNDLLAAKTKILKQLRYSEVKYGPNASSTTLLKEKLEENVCNLGVVEIQYIRAITKNLKDALIDYLYALQSVSANISDATNDYYEILLSLESGQDLARNSPRKIGNGMSGLNRKDLNFNTSNSYGLLSKSANEVDYNLPKNSGFQERNSPIRMTSQVADDYQNYSNCVECQKNNKYHHRLITPCTHNGSNIDPRTSKSIHMSPTRISQDNISVQGFEIKDGYLPSEHWN
ncbi:uncharacterized protein AC631_03801 [Debaryomyces fabryi]|uniref:Uncharacterized protein n=1 Tax=Debaryomyces fabryi TaxID=58627 RepID=A0A0V1PVZ9_9ASCO|nr:uncharacterized protein AC631_03801 [Debaryomyces fabryi]KSA00423.1 hypothetical protein AC631_03801 [Debaryomyces fabryi]CUM46500.1 unnamed protein product [Debaryomyces fabryi]